MEWIKLRGRSSSYGESVLEKEDRKRKGEKKKEEKEKHKEGEREEEAFPPLVLKFWWIKNWSYTIQEVKDFFALFISLFGTLEMAFG